MPDLSRQNTGQYAQISSMPQDGAATTEEPTSSDLATLVSTTTYYRESVSDNDESQPGSFEEERSEAQWSFDSFETLEPLDIRLNDVSMGLYGNEEQEEGEHEANADSAVPCGSAPRGS